MKKAVERAVAQYLLQSTNPSHGIQKAVPSNRHGASFYGGSESEEYSQELNHISQEIKNQLSSAINLDAVKVKCLSPVKKTQQQTKIQECSYSPPHLP